MNTTIAAAASVLSMGVLMKCIHKKFDSGHVSLPIVEQAWFDLLVFGDRTLHLIDGGLRVVVVRCIVPHGTYCTEVLYSTVLYYFTTRYQPPDAVLFLLVNCGRFSFPRLNNG